MANLRPILGRPVVATATTGTFGLLQISPTEAQAFSYTGRIQSLQDATKDLNAHAGVSTSDHNLITIIHYAVWRLVDKHNGDRRHTSLCLGWASRRREMFP